QIKHINKEADNIQENLNKSQYHLEGIKYWWKNINSFLGFETFNNIENKKTNNQLNDDTKKRINHNIKNTYEKNCSQNYKSSLNIEGSTQISIHYFFKGKGTFDENYERDLSTLSSMLDELHTRALIMGNTISSQNKMLSDVNEKMEINIEKIRDQQKMMKDIMKK
ncbi:SNARE protein, putative, partial [Plasmodium malariae]